jgi:hypothetical protein
MNITKEELVSLITNIVYTVLNNEGVLRGPWRLGKVESVVSNNLLRVYIDDSETAQTVPCDPDKNFIAGDDVYVVYINGDPKDKFVTHKRATGTVSTSGLVYTLKGEIITTNNGSELFV